MNTQKAVNEAITFIEMPGDFSRENYRSIGVVQAEALRFGEEFHYDKYNPFAPYLRDALKTDRVVEHCSLFFAEDGYLFRVVRPSYLSIQLYVFEPIGLKERIGGYLNQIGYGIILILSLLVVGCQSKSGHIPPKEFKAVVLDLRNDTIEVHRDRHIYVNVARLKDLEQGVIISRQLPVNAFYEIGDTIMLTRTPIR